MERHIESFKSKIYKEIGRHEEVEVIYDLGGMGVNEFLRSIDEKIIWTFFIFYPN